MRATTDHLAATQMAEHDDMSSEQRWSAWCRRVRLSTARAELETWQQIMREIDHG